MKSFRTKPRHNLAEPAVWCAGFGLLCLAATALQPAVGSFILILGLVYLAIAAGVWQESKIAVIAGGVLFSIGIVSRIAGLFTAFSWAKAGSGLLFAWLAFRLFSALRDWEGESGTGKAADGTPDEPMISIVLFLSEPKALDEPILARIVEDAWGGDYTSEDEEKQDGFVAGENPFYLVKSPQGMFAVHNHAAPYFDDLESVAGDIGELRLREAVLRHRAWLSVDLFSPADDSLPRETFYPPIIRLIHEFADETTLVAYRPETGELNLWSDDVLEALLMPSGENRFSRIRAEVPVIRVDSNDEAMARAVAEAQDRWNEFVTAFQSRGKDDTFSIKAPVTVGENTEFIWIEVDGIASGVVFGKLGNHPVSLKGLHLGSPVAVPFEEINDWCYLAGGGDPVGLFTLKAVQEAERRFQDRADSNDGKA